MPWGVTSAIRAGRSSGRLLLWAWRAVRTSRLGTIGLVMVLVFAAIALLAPIISPHSRSFLAPDADRFVVAEYRHPLPANHTFAGPVVGPTTPLYSNKGGGIWEINYNGSSGLIVMDFLQNSLRGNVSPYEIANLSLSFDVNQDLGLTLPLQLPLTAVYYIVPATNLSGLGTPVTSGEPVRNGALALFAGRDFAVVDPFAKSQIFRYRLNFTPQWTGEDPASAGRMLIAPAQSFETSGLIGRPIGPYHYFYASSANETVVFETVYVHTSAAAISGASYPGAPGGQVVLDVRVPISAPPFVYYNQQQVTSPDHYRTGPGQAVVLPLANGSLAVYSVGGTFLRSIALSLANESATVTGPIGYTQSADFPLWLYLPLGSASQAGVAVLDLSSLTLPWKHVLPGSGWTPVVPVYSRVGTKILAAFYRASNSTTLVFALDNTGAAIPQFRAYFPNRIRDLFDAYEVARVFIFAGDGRIYSMDEGFQTGALSIPVLFSVVPPKGVLQIVYAGSFGGTLYGINLSAQELSGFWTSRTTALTGTFQFLGTSRTPLPPGCYPSGNCYLLGTDYYGADILTELFWGTQVAFIVGILAALFGVGIGTFVGLISGYYGKLVDTLLMRTTDIFLVLPFLPIVLIFVEILRPSIWIIIMTLAILGWPGVARVIRAQVLSLKERPFVDAARVSGASDMRLVFLHLAPNVLPFSFLYMSLGVAGAIITEAALSFLGLGDPTVISWGGMLEFVITSGSGLYAWWWILPPGLGITLLSLGFYLLGRGFDEIINPRLRRR